MFEDFGRGFLDAPTRGGTPVPAVDVAEHDTEYEITMELPGMLPEQVDVSVANGMLTIAGEKSSEEEKGGKDFHVSERRFGSFRRSFRLPDTVDGSAIEAGMSHGVLTVHLPKSAKAQEREQKIDIKAR
jgi:HSP20 family protein